MCVYRNLVLHAFVIFVTFVIFVCSFWFFHSQNDSSEVYSADILRVAKASLPSVGFVPSMAQSHLPGPIGST